MAPGNIEEVGARLVVKGREAYRAGIRSARADIKALAADTTKANAQMVAAQKAYADAQAEAAARSKAAADALEKSLAAKAAATKAAAAGDAEAATAARAYADAMAAEATEAANVKRVAAAQAAAAGRNVTALRAQAAAHAAHARGVNASTAAISGLAKVGKVAVLGGITAGAVAAYQGAKAFATYQQALEAVHTQAGLTQARVDKLGRSLLGISGGGKIPVGPTDLANILYRVVSSTSGMHYSNKRLLAMTRAAAQLAVIGGPGTDIEQTARIVGGIRATGIKGAGSPQNIVSLANATVGAGDIRMQDFVDFVGTGVLSSGRLAGVTLPQVAAMLSLLGDNLMAGNVSGHSIAHALQLLAAPSHVGMQAYRAIGLGGTQIADEMRTKGLPAAIGTLMAHLHAPINTRNADTVAYLKKYLGLTSAQIHEVGKTGLTPSMQDMILTRAFGGAKQAIPIMTILQQLPRYNAKLAESKKLIGNFGETWNATMKEPANQLKALNAQWQTFEVRVGSEVLPKAIALVHWLQQHKQLVKDIAIGLSIALIPATAAWIGTLATRGITTVGNFLGLMKNVGPAAEGTVQPLNGMGKAVMGVTAAVGVFELGRATAGHGAGGLVTAGLGGALTGLVTGLAIGGPFGAAIGGAVGLLGGLASNLYASAHAADAANRAMRGWMSSAYKADNFKLGAQFRSQLTTSLQANPKLASILADANVSIGQIVGDIRSGNAIGGPAGLQLQLAVRTGKISQQAFQQGLQGLQTLVTNFGGIVGNLDDIAKISGIVSQHTSDLKASANSLANVIYAQPTTTGGSTKPPSLAGLLGVPVGHRATGGHVLAGHLYQVNERGTELFMPSMSGTVLPHAAMPILGGDGSAMHGAGAGGGHPLVIQEFIGVLDDRSVFEAAKRGARSAMARL